MDSVNTKIGQNFARENASVLTDKSFATSNMIGLSSGASQFAKSENFKLVQQVKNTQETLVSIKGQELAEKQEKLKDTRQNADKILREESVSFLQTLSNINELLQTNGTKISFNLEIDPNSSAKDPVVVVTDKESGNVIRQIPSEEMQKFAEQVRELEPGSLSRRGLVLDKQA